MPVTRHRKIDNLVNKTALSFKNIHANGYP